MDVLNQIPERYSATIKLWLECAQGRFPLAQVGNTFIVSDEPLNLPSGDAVVAVSVDGQLFSRTVDFRGMTGDSREATILAKDDIPL